MILQDWMERQVLNDQMSARAHSDQKVADTDVPRQEAFSRRDPGTKHRKVVLDEGNKAERNLELAAEQVSQMVERRIEFQTGLLLHLDHLVQGPDETKTQANELLVSGRSESPAPFQVPLRRLEIQRILGILQGQFRHGLATDGNARRMHTLGIARNQRMPVGQSPPLMDPPITA